MSPKRSNSTKVSSCFSTCGRSSAARRGGRDVPLIADADAFCNSHQLFHRAARPGRTTRPDRSKAGFGRLSGRSRSSFGSIGARKAACGCPSALSCGSCTALRAVSPAVLARVAPPRNSLRSLRSLRSDSLGEFDFTRRAARAGHAKLRSSAPQMRAAGHPPTSLRGPARLFVERLRREAGIEPASRRAPQARAMPDSRARRLRCRLPLTKRCGGLQRRGRVAGGATLRRRGAQWLVAARAARLVKSTRRDCLSVVSAANEASFATGHETRAAQGTMARRAVQEPQSERDGLPGRGFARA